LLLGASLGEATAGHYSRAIILAHIPFLLVGNSVAQVFYQQAAASHAAGRSVGELVQQVVERLIWISLLPMAMVALIGPDLFTVVLGGQWGVAGAYARILAGWLFLEGVALPLTGLIRILGRLGAGLVFNVILVGGQSLALVIGGWALGSQQASILLLAAVGAAVHGCLCLFLVRASGASLLRVGASLLRYAAYALPALAVAAVAKWSLALADWQVVLAAAVASLSYVALVLRHDEWAARQFAGVIGRISRRRGA